VKGFSHFLTLGLLGSAMIIACPRAGAQQFGLSVTPSANAILVSNSLTYIITVTNLGAGLNDAVVTNILPATAQFQIATNFYSAGTFTNGSNMVLFDLGLFPAGQIAQMTVTAIPTAVGFITNTVVVVATGTTNTASTNVVVLVTNSLVLADLGVTLTGPGQAVITNDWMTYGVTVTNAGPGAASGVVLTNTLPAIVLFKGIFPTNQPFAIAGSNMIINLGTLTNGGNANLQFTVEPTNADVLLFSASVGSSGAQDTNTANNFASNNVTVIGYLPGTLVAVTNSAQSTNFVNGLLEQTITVSNAGLSSVPAARLVVTGLTNRLFNAVGTNNGNPFVYYSTNLAAGQSVDLLLQYFPRRSFPFTNSQLQAFAVSVPSWTPPVVTATSTNINISRLVELANGNMLIEWPSVLGRTYTVVYSDNVSFSNAMIAPPSIVAPANDMEWIDYGPPTTVSVPTNAARFYRVYQNP
jgi:uncharacterized repeat protein (TIGR01451 family)